MGGNVFKGKTSSIKKEYIDYTLENYYKDLCEIFPNKAHVFHQFLPVGSVGKKPISGDIDLAVDSSLLIDISPLLSTDNSNDPTKEWGLDIEDVKAKFDKFKKRARTANDEQIMMRAFLSELVLKINQESRNVYCDEKKVTSGNIFTLSPQYDENNTRLDKGVQIDWMIGDVSWLQFSYYSEEYRDNVKGLHRTQLILSMFHELGYIFKHADGVIDSDTREILATTPKEAIDILNREYNINLNDNIISNYFKLRIYLADELDECIYLSIIKTYLKILDKTRCDIPIDIQNHWISLKDEIGLTGKFLPDNSLLIGN